MFTGIVENIGKIVSITKSEENIRFEISSPISSELKVDQSVAHNGVCLTVEKIDHTTHTVCAIKETLDKTTLAKFRTGDEINLERCMTLNARLDGHMVQGHVDQTGTCINISEKKGSWEFTFQYLPKENITVEKGSICVNGISLTVVKSLSDQFSVHIIPYTFENTIMKNLKIGDEVNLEFDIIGKYVSRYMQAFNLRIA